MKILKVRIVYDQCICTASYCIQTFSVQEYSKKNIVCLLNLVLIYAPEVNGTYGIRSWALSGCCFDSVRYVPWLWDSPVRTATRSQSAVQEGARQTGRLACIHVANVTVVLFPRHLQTSLECSYLFVTDIMYDE